MFYNDCDDDSIRLPYPELLKEEDSVREEREFQSQTIPHEYMPLAPPCFLEVEEIFSRTGFNAWEHFDWNESQVPFLSATIIPKDWLTTPHMKIQGKTNTLAAAVLAEITTGILLQSCMDSYYKNLYEDIWNDNDLDPDVADVYCDCLSETELKNRLGFPTSLDDLADRTNASRENILETIQFLEEREIISTCDAKLLTDESILYIRNRNGYRKVETPNFSFKVNVVTPTLAEMTLPDLCCTAKSDLPACEFLLRLAQCQWKRERGTGLNMLAAYQKYRNRLVEHCDELTKSF